MLIDAPAFQEVRQLWMHTLHAASAQKLAKSQTWKLQSFRTKYLDSPRALDLFRSPTLANLRELSIGGGGPNHDVSVPLAANEHLGNVRRLELHGCELGPEGLRRLIENSCFQDLHVLDLGRNKLKDAGGELLAKWPALANVVRLNIDGNGFKEKGYQAICDSPYLQNLRRLTVRPSIAKKFKNLLRERFGEVVCEFRQGPLELLHGVE